MIAFPSPASAFLPESLCRKGFNEKSILTPYSTSEQATYRLLRLFQKSECAHCVVPPFQIEPASLGFDLVWGAISKENRFYPLIAFEMNWVSQIWEARFFRCFSPVFSCCALWLLKNGGIQKNGWGTATSPRQLIPMLIWTQRRLNCLLRYHVLSSHPFIYRSKPTKSSLCRFAQPVEKRPVCLHYQTGHKVNEG